MAALEQDDIGLLYNYETRIRRLGSRMEGRWGKDRKWMPVQIMSYCRSNCWNYGGLSRVGGKNDGYYETGYA